MKINKDSVKKIAVGIGKALAYGSLTMLSMNLNKEAETIYYDDLDCKDYSGAVESIMQSDMSSYYKNQAIAMLKKDLDESYYRSVASIARSNDLDYYKVNMINALNK